MTRYPVRCLILTALLVLIACGRAGSYSDDGNRPRDIRAAEECYLAARAERAEDPAACEALLRRALDHDLYHGPAHNDLGVLLQARGELYAAAQEFEWARKLMPGHPDPRVNLAVILELGGKHGDSIQAARAALESRAGYLPALQTLTWVQLRNDLADEDTVEQLDAIVARSDDPAWRDWATRWRFKLAARQVP